jgi:hypothetical protein
VAVINDLGDDGGSRLRTTVGDDVGDDLGDDVGDGDDCGDNVGNDASEGDGGDASGEGGEGSWRRTRWWQRRRQGSGGGRGSGGDCGGRGSGGDCGGRGSGGDCGGGGFAGVVSFFIICVYEYVYVWESRGIAIKKHEDDEVHSANRTIVSFENRHIHGVLTSTVVDTDSGDLMEMN